MDLKLTVLKFALARKGTTLSGRFVYTYCHSDITVKAVAALKHKGF